MSYARSTTPLRQGEEQKQNVDKILEQQRGQTSVTQRSQSSECRCRQNCNITMERTIQKNNTARHPSHSAAKDPPSLCGQLYVSYDCRQTTLLLHRTSENAQRGQRSRTTAETKFRNTAQPHPMPQHRKSALLRNFYAKRRAQMHNVDKHPD